MPNTLKRFLDAEGLEALINQTKAADEKVKQEAKDYADSLALNYDPAGTGQTIKQELQGKIDTLQSELDADKQALSDEIARAKEAESANATTASNAQQTADKAQGDVDALGEYVGEIPTTSTAKDIIAYIQEKTAGIATDTALEELTGRVAESEEDIANIVADYLKKADKDELQALIDAVSAKADDNASNVAAILADYLKKADKDELNGKIAEAKQTADAAQGYAESVADDLAEEAQARTEADSAQVERIAVLEGKILELNGAMHFRGIKTEVPTDFSGYENGDVIIVGNKEYVFDGTKFEEFGDVGALTEAITALTARMDGAEEDISDILDDLEEIRDAITTKVEQSVYDAKIGELEAKDADYAERIANLEGKFTTGEGSVEDMIADKAQEVQNAAAQDATDKANKALEDSKAYTNAEVNKDRARLEALEADRHTHNNKTVLDGITESKVTAWDGAVTKAHEHGNKSELDKIQEGDVAKWNSAEQNAKDYAKSLSDATNAQVDALTDRVGDVESAVSTKAESSVVTALSEKLTTAEANIASNTAAIAAFTPIPVADVIAYFNA